MSRDGTLLALGTVAALAGGAALSRRGSRAEAEVYDRNGFPWPAGVPAYHATAFVPEIVREGFKTREMGAAEMLGGRWRRSVSVTLSLPRAASIALPLETLIRGARGDLSCVQLLDALALETPKAIRMGIVSGYDLQAVTMRKPYEVAFRDLRAVLARIDRGWSWWSAGLTRPDNVPRGTIRIDDAHFLVPPRVPVPPLNEHGDRRDDRGWFMRAPQVFFETLKSVLSSCGGFGETAGDCFNPRFMGTRMDVLAKRRPEDVGVLLAEVKLPRVCPDARGAVRLGYVTEDEIGHPGSYLSNDVLDGNEHNCQQALESGITDPARADPAAEYQARRAQAPIGGGWTLYPKIGAWPLVDTGVRQRSTTFLFHAGEEEGIVYDPSAVVVRRVLPVAEIRRRFDLGDRLTFPYFDDDAVDVRVWPPGVRASAQGSSARRAAVRRPAR